MTERVVQKEVEDAFEEVIKLLKRMVVAGQVDEVLARRDGYIISRVMSYYMHLAKEEE